METLPAVAKNVYHYCSKCETERYHRVLAHLSPTEARLECEVCGSKRKLKIGKSVATKKKTTRKTRTKGPSHVEVWTELKEKYSDLDPEAYSIRGVFRADTLIDHPSFGIGVVTSAHPNKIEVCFEEGVKTLMHKKDL
ncbi:MAG: hypothetical protein MJK18_14640 [Bdellovibrionales bacterium]|nr:hypothetical protein [Bdellovibrionales bacterium]